MSTMTDAELARLQAVISRQGTRMSQMRWTLERILQAAEGTSGLSWSEVGDLARRALESERAPGA